MENTVISRVDQPKVPAVSGTGTFVAVFFLAWLALIFVLGARSSFVAPRGAPPLALLIGLLAPLGLFLLGYRTIPPLREFVLSADLRIIVGIQAWRWAGFGFLTLYTYGVLPGIFAWPAGLGDMAIGVTAPLVLAALLRRPGFAAGKSFVAWNLSGILDPTVAVRNQLEALRGNRKGQHSIRINDQRRICFIWREGHCYDVEIVDYH